MDKEELEKLGFTHDLDWKSEVEEKRALIEKINQLKNRAFHNVKTDLLQGSGPSAPGAGPAGDASVFK